MDRPPTAHWGVTADLQRLAGGHRNLAFRTLGLQRELVFKSTRRSPADIGWVLDVQHIARRSGFVVPLVIESLNNRIIEDGWTCETFIEGSQFTPDALPAILPQISAFHEATSGMAQRPGFLSSQALLEQAAGGDVDLDSMPPDLVSLCRDAWRAVSTRSEAVVHGDLNAGNLLRCRDGRAALLDWDECRRDLTLFDLGQLRDDDKDGCRARLAWEIACSWQIEPDHARSLARRL